MSKSNVIIFGILIAFIVVVWFFQSAWEVMKNRDNAPAAPAVTSFEECAAAGNPVMPARHSLGAGGESYPRQCRAGDETFVEDIITPILPDTSTSTPDNIGTTTPPEKEN